MPAYTTIVDVRNASGMHDVTKMPDAYITTKIAGATGIINSKIGDAYVLPLNPVPDLVTFAALELTVALLYIDQYGDEAKNGDKGWKKRMDYFLSEDVKDLGILVKIQQLKMKLYNPTTGLELQRNTLRLPAFYPTDSSSDPSLANNTGPKTTINERF